MNLKALKSLPILLICSIFILLTSCKNYADNPESTDDLRLAEKSSDSLFFELSLAQWSVHNQIYNEKLSPMDFAETASKLGFTGIEYVSGFYADSIKSSEDPEKEMQTILQELKTKSEKFGVKNVLIMVDGEGDLAVNDSVQRKKAVENHKKWVDAANFLGCHGIRVNLFGSNDPQKWISNSVDALTALSKYAAEKNINVLVENHGYLSSNADLLVDVIKKVNMENCGTLPDFGNFCLRREGGERWDTSCVEEYPRYEGVRKLLPYAKAISAKSYSFDENGEEETIDYKKMLKMVKEAGYTGFIGVEYEGTAIPEEQGIMKTRNLLIEAAQNL